MPYQKKHLVEIESFVLANERSGLIEARNVIDRRIQTIESQLQSTGSSGFASLMPVSGNSVNPAPKKRVLSIEARRRMAAAQKARWAALRKSQEPVASPSPAPPGRRSKKAGVRSTARTSKLVNDPTNTGLEEFTA